MDPLSLHIYAEDVVRSRVRPPKFINDRDFRMIERLPCRVAGIAGSARSARRAFAGSPGRSPAAPPAPTPAFT